MSVLFEFDTPSWECAPCRHAVRVVATLLPWECRLAPSGDHEREARARVAVGLATHAHDEADVLMRFEGWRAWAPSDVRTVEWRGALLLSTNPAELEVVSERELPVAWLRTVGSLLQREEELHEPHRDEWGNFSAFFSRQHELGVLGSALVNRLAAQLETRLRKAFESRSQTPIEVPRWKNGARMAVALSHDVDWVRLNSRRDAIRLLGRARGPRSYAFRAGVAQLARSIATNDDGDPYWNFERWVDEESRRGFRSTFYFCPFSPTRPHEYDATYRSEDPIRWRGRLTTVARLMRGLGEAGFEVGLHGSYGSHLDPEELGRQKRQIETSIGQPVSGIRQHFLRLDVRRTWTAQERAGFLHDSTLGYNEAIGFRGGLAAPARAWDAGLERTLGLLVIPMTVMDGALFRTLKLDAALAVRRVREHLDVVQAEGGLAGLLWHPNAADERSFPGWWQAYVEVLDDLARRDAWVTTVGEIAEAWRARERATVTEHLT